MRGWQVVPVVALVMVLAPAASGQLTVEASPIVDRLVPGTGTLPFDITVTLACDDALRALDPSTQTVRLDIAFGNVPDGVTVSGSATMLLVARDCAIDPASSISGKAMFAVAATRDVPGLVPMKLSADVHATPRVGDPIQGSAEVPFTVDYYGLLDVQVDTKVLEVAPAKDARFTAKVTNNGNALTTVAIIVDQNGGASYKGPETVTLKPAEEIMVDLPFGTNDEPGFDNREHSIRVTFTPQAVADTTRHGDMVSANLLLRVRSLSDGGEETASPAPVGLLVGLVLLGCALAARRGDD